MMDATLSVLEKALDLQSKRQEIHTSNIANANVPHFKAKRLDFEKRMQNALEEASAERPMRLQEALVTEAVENLEGDTYEDPLLRMNGSGNTVNMEKEQIDLAKNTVAMETSMELLNRKLAMQKFAIREGR